MGNQWTDDPLLWMVDVLRVAALFFPVLEKVMGSIVNVNDDADVDQLLAVELMV